MSLSDRKLYSKTSWADNRNIVDAYQNVYTRLASQRLFEGLFLLGDGMV